MMLNIMQSCPCGVPRPYAQCCQLLHQGQQAISAEQLMRSRYAAFALGEINYIVQTTVPAQQGLLDVKAISSWSQQNQWLGLSIVSSQPCLKPRHARVEFMAHFKHQQSEQQQSEQQPGEQQQHELSSFVRIDGRWYFLDPTVQSVTRLKSACLCGSGQKFKRCCAPFLAPA